MITRENYEAYFLDYVEGDLSTEDMDLLLEFLEQNPDLRQELKAFDEDVLLKPSFAGAVDFSFLKQTDFEKDIIGDSNAEDFVIAKFEKDLSPDKEQELELFLNKNKLKKEELAVYEQLKLQPDPHAIFEGKEDLKKKTIVFGHWTRYAAIAAMFLIVAGLFVYNYQANHAEGEEGLSAVQLEKEPDEFQYSENTGHVEEKGTEEVNGAVENVVNVFEEHNTPKEFKTEVKVRDANPDVNGSQDRLADKPERLTNVQYFVKKEQQRSVIAIDLPLTNGIAHAIEPGENIQNEWEEVLGEESGMGKQAFSLRDFITQKAKKEVLKSEDQDNRIKKTDFGNLVAKLFNGKMTIDEKEDNKVLVSYSGKFLSYSTTMKN